MLSNPRPAGRMMLMSQVRGRAKFGETDSFWKNPIDPSLSHWGSFRETIEPSAGQRLMPSVLAAMSPRNGRKQRLHLPQGILHPRPIDLFDSNPRSARSTSISVNSVPTVVLITVQTLPHAEESTPAMTPLEHYSIDERKALGGTVGGPACWADIGLIQKRRLFAFW